MFRRRNLCSNIKVTREYLMPFISSPSFKSQRIHCDQYHSKKEYTVQRVYLFSDEEKY